MRIASLFRLGWLAWLPSCTTVPPGVVSIEARGALYSEEALEFIGSGIFDGSYSSTSRTPEGTGGAHYHSHRNSSDENAAYGLRAAISTPVVDLVGGGDKRWFDDRGADEVSFGLRKRLFESTDSGPGYVMLLARRGRELRTDSGLEDYDGVTLGIGGIAPMGEHWFLDYSLEADWLLEEVEIDSNDTHLFSLMFNLGIGFSP